jgi:hypothetical protein
MIQARITITARHIVTTISVGCAGVVGGSSIMRWSGPLIVSVVPPC